MNSSQNDESRVTEENAPEKQKIVFTREVVKATRKQEQSGRVGAYPPITAYRN
jgi:hypothetical protein